MAERPRVSLVVTDLDNTLWDWFAAWYHSFSALLQGVVQISGIEIDVLISEARRVHQRHGTSEYTFLLEEMPSIRSKYPESDVSDVFAEAIAQYRAARNMHTRLYPTVMETLLFLRSAHVPVAAYTESLAYFTARRLKKLQLDGLIDRLFSGPDHDFPDGVAPESIRSRDQEVYEFRLTRHEYLTRGLTKPNPDVLMQILSKYAARPEETLYVGDSLLKDVAMAQSVGVLDVHAEYGVVHDKNAYDLLRSVSHWTDEDVQREKMAMAAPLVTPTWILRESFGEMRELFDFGGASGS